MSDLLGLAHNALSTVAGYTATQVSRLIPGTDHNIYDVSKVLRELVRTGFATTATEDMFLVYFKTTKKGEDSDNLA